MITNKHITQIISLLMAAAVLICILAMVLSQRLAVAVGGTAVSMQYDTELFDHSELIEIDIQMKDEEWEKMLNRASEEEYFSCDVVINGEKVRNVGIRPKGNTSLSAIAMDPDTDRFSLKLEFDHYVEGQTCYGLDKLILNNNYADSTNMKEAIVYDMYEYLETDASLYNYARISVNGEYWGVYLALEAVEDSFLLRNYGTVNVALYKPESMDMGGGPGAKEAAFMQRPEPPKDMENEPKPFEKGNFTPSGRDGKFSMSGKGGDLNYTDSSLDSYTTIWEGEVTDTNENDHRRVVTALEHISKGTDLEQYLDVENVLKYMAVHTFSVNLDSLSGAMAHNYYLYESDGELNILPWDYNLSFGGMNVGKDNSATQMINDAIDTPFQGTRFFDALLENEEYLSRYHAYLKKLTEEYVFGGKFEETYERIRNQIDGLVATDPTGFYSYDEYEEGVNMLYTTVMLRAESIQGQLEGTIPSTDDGQRENSSKLVDASGIEIDIMGEFSMER